MKFRIIASLAVIAVVIALLALFGGDHSPSSSSNPSSTEFGNDAINSMRQ